MREFEIMVLRGAFGPEMREVMGGDLGLLGCDSLSLSVSPCFAGMC